jgi:hypothetical protein
MKACLESTSVSIALLFFGFSVGSGPLHAAEPSDVAWARVKDADHWTEIVTSAVTGTTLPDRCPPMFRTSAPNITRTRDRIGFIFG